MRALERPRLSPPAAGLLLGVFVAFADILLVTTSWLEDRPNSPLPAAGVLAILATWTTVCTLTGLVFSASRLGRFRALPLVFIGPGLLLLSRVAPWMKETFRLSFAVSGAICFLMTVLLALPFSLIRFEKTRSWRWWWSGALLSLGVLVAIAADLHPRDWTSPDSPPPPAASPNVLLVFLDTVTWHDSIGSSQPAMPALARFARGALRFDDAWAPAAWTEPTHLSVLTGVDHWLVKDDDPPPPMLQDRFRRLGYATGAVFANPVLTRFSRGFDEVTSSRRSPVCSSGFAALLWRSPSYGGPRFPICSALNATEVTARATGFIRHTRRPYFLALNYLDAHDPYHVPLRCRDGSFRAAARAERFLVVKNRPKRKQPSAEVTARVREQYRAAMRCMDHSVGALLEEAGRDPNTIIAVVSDHGEQFGEHGFGGHSNTLYRQVLHVPLVLRIPRVPPATVTDTVSISDLYASILRAADPNGVGMIALLDPAARRPAISSFAYRQSSKTRSADSAFSLARNGDHLMIWNDGRQMLFRYRDDPAELKEIAPATTPALHASMLEVLLREKQRQRGTSEFRALGYLQ